MRYAIISDIHSNLAALNAVLEDLDQQGVEEVLCLGDVIGYGPDPIECTDLIMKHCGTVLRGNHDEALTVGAWSFNTRAKRALDWTREQLIPAEEGAEEAAKRRWDFVTNLPLRHEIGEDLFVHGSPRDPTNEYIMPLDLSYAPSEKFAQIFEAFSERLFVGHTHIPCVITEDLACVFPADVEYTYTHEGKRAIVNVGSVGQPRDRDNRACYVVVDGPTVHYRRVSYDFEATRSKILSIPELDPLLGERLREGY